MLLPASSEGEMGEKVPSLCKRPLFVNSVPYKGRLVSPASYGNRAALGPSLPSLVPSLPSRKKRNGMAQPTLPAPRPPSIGLCSNPPEDALPPGSPLVHTSSVLCASLCLGYPFCRGKKILQGSGLVAAPPRRVLLTAHRALLPSPLQVSKPWVPPAELYTPPPRRDMVLTPST